MIDLLTTSRLRAARSCLRYHQLRYIDRYAPARDADELRFGKLFHVGLEAWWRAPQGGRLGPALDALRAAGEADPYDLAKAEVLLIGYDARWDAEPLEVLSVEQQFEGKLVNPQTGAASKTWLLAGRLDAVVRDQAGRVLVCEHKTASDDIRQGSDYWRRLRMDGQISVYYEGARLLGYDVQGCLYDVIGKPRQRPLKATPPPDRRYTKSTGKLDARQREQDETPAEYRQRLAETIGTEPTAYYQRGEVVRLEADIAEHRADTWQFAQALRAMMVAGRAPRNPDSCVRFNRTCEFFPVCCHEASLDDQTKYRRLPVVHPELAEVASAAEG